jgi:hypothetical protein
MKVRPGFRLNPWRRCSTMKCSPRAFNWVPFGVWYSLGIGSTSACKGMGERLNSASSTAFWSGDSVTTSTLTLFRYRSGASPTSWATFRMPRLITSVLPGEPRVVTCILMYGMSGRARMSSSDTCLSWR